MKLERSGSPGHCAGKGRERREAGNGQCPRNEEAKGSRIRGFEEMRISPRREVGIYAALRDFGPPRRISAALRDCGMQSAGHDPRATKREPRTTNHESRKTSVAERSQSRATRWNAMSKHRLCHNLSTGCALGSDCGRAAVCKALGISWSGQRRERDSNPRYGYPHTRFPSVLLKPLGHLS